MAGFYELAANITALTHGAFILLVFLGIFVSIRVKRYRPIESFLFLSLVVVWSLYGGCPLTSVEDAFRTWAGNPTTLKATGFISHYLSELFGIDAPRSAVDAGTYGTAALFLMLTIKWELPVLKKLQHRLVHKRHRNKK